MRFVRGFKAHFLLSMAFLSVLLSGCVLVRFFNKDFNHNQYQIVRVVLDGQTFDFKDLIEEAQRPQTQEAQNQTPKATNAPKPLPKNKLELLQAELEQRVKNLDTKDISPDASMIKKDMRHLESDIKHNKTLTPPVLVKSPMGHIEFDQRQLRAYGMVYCNKYFFSYNFRDDDHLVLDDKGIARRVCGNEKLMAFELAFYNHLEGVFNITRGKNTLLLEGPKMTIYMQH
ncbi:secreted protein involved in flagellar motility [Helicobacter heilmannii]|uniref:Putative motility protein n=3 Tax=Helicobacter heilmannii TaxID=35817 RepID=A0A0K2Y723_HELHE|nr:META domain-containing protein [Helicobacter heilmannii]CCM11546.1 secreted protein involved in flagellar motility [Helicobacter heilmannii ASB1.4]CRF45192.1 secreted protein involved in flagellar motility [Helicobacter heilmannii]CRF46800.1 secreted protein involved in flagellar motility [Helicobacter heilmannii]CRI34966.1 putative motility protein [Helicobacter heilmannii]